MYSMTLAPPHPHAVGLITCWVYKIENGSHNEDNKLKRLKNVFKMHSYLATLRLLWGEFILLIRPVAHDNECGLR